MEIYYLINGKKYLDTHLLRQTGFNKMGIAGSDEYISIS